MPTSASTTAAGIARRFTAQHLAGVERAVGQVNGRMVALVGRVRRSMLLGEVTIDADTTDVEVYGRAKRTPNTTISVSAICVRIWRSGRRPGCRWLGS